MKIFISWSGETSHKVAVALRDWLPTVIQCVKPYVSSEDIDKGARWSTDIAKELEESSFGILCVTKDNIDAPWLNFEAGALGKSVEKNKVSPLLFGVKPSDIKDGPILQFQSTAVNKEDVLKLLKSINSSCGELHIEDVVLEKVYDHLWPSLETTLNEINVSKSPVEVKEKKTGASEAKVEKILEEMLELSRFNQKILRNPEEILPPEYLLRILRNSDQPPSVPLIEPILLADLSRAFYDTTRCFEGVKMLVPPEATESLRMEMERLGRIVIYFLEKFGSERERSMRMRVREAMRFLRN